MNPKRAILLCLLCFFVCNLFAQSESQLDYTVRFTDAAQHRVHVTMSFPIESGWNQVQLPVWNALYQVRDFAKNIISVTAEDASGKAIPLKQADKTTWQFVASDGRARIDYDIILDEAGPFGAQFNTHHAFLNFAELLMYPVKGREWPISVQFTGVPPRWKLATSLPSLSVPAETAGAPSAYVLHAEKYDRLVDSPCELGEFAESDFEQSGGKYRVVIDADPADYDASSLVAALTKITAAETEWMDDRPFDTYVFIYHFPRGPAGGGMEHAYSTAIDISASQLKELRGFESTSAHEFFHLWNVKRIRPQSLEPIDYTRENYTRALWFSEGVTSTVADLALLKAGLLTPAEYFERIARGITVLEARPAHLTQSAEESSLDTWFDKYPNYRAPERSISYYNKGDLLGILLDLKIRQDSHGQHSLRDLFKEMNQDYAKRGRYFADSDGVREEAEKLTKTDLHDFFDRYVAGTAELPYSELFATVGLILDKQQQSVADTGFTAARNFTGPLMIDQVNGEEARSAGLREGDEIVSINGEQPARSVDQQIASSKPGEKIRIVVLRRGERKDIELTLGQKTKQSYMLREAPQAMPAKLARRAAWLQSQDEGE